ncbi:unnamed protein product [Sympodiomycopsis kandeliae]
MVVASQSSSDLAQWRVALNAWLEQEIKLTASMSFKPIQFKLEAFVFALALLYLLLHFIGKKKNHRLADTWVKEALPAIEKEFATTAKDGQGKGELLLWNGGDESVFYASGRRSVESLHAHFNLTPRHDPLLHLYNILYDIAVASPISSARDTLTLSFVLPPTADNTSGVFAVVDKSVLQSLRSVRPFDLSFARLLDTNDSREARGLDNKWAIMSENAELTDAFLGPMGASGDERRHKIGIQTVLNSSAGNWLESLILTDLPQDRPESDATFNASSYPRLLILNLRVPPSSSTSQLSLPLLTLSTNILDAIEFSYIKLSDKCQSKIKKTRTDFEKEVEKEKEREKKLEEEEERIKRKAAEEKIKREGLSEKELAKKKELDEKRARRKQQGKQRIRG